MRLTYCIIQQENYEFTPLTGGNWGNLKYTVLHILQVLQKTYLHIYKLSQRHSTSDLFNKHCRGVLNVKSMYEANVAHARSYTMQSIIHRSNTLSLKTPSHIHNTRNRDELLVAARKSKLLVVNFLIIYRKTLKKPNSCDSINN